MEIIMYSCVVIITEITYTCVTSVLLLCIVLERLINRALINQSALN